MIRPLRIGIAGALLSLAALPVLAGKRSAFPLNDCERIGQRFTTPRPIDGLWVIVPSWLDAEGGLTLTLWESSERKRKLARRVFTDVPDNARVTLSFPKPLPRGAYYWEVHDRTGTTRIGLYGERLDEEDANCAYFDGVPDRELRFVFGATPTAFPYTDTAEMIAVLASGPSPAERDALCRQLAVQGTEEAVGALTELLADRSRSHMARYALEAMPQPAAGAALRGALDALDGDLLVGVVNSVGEKADPEAVRPLRRLLRSKSPGVAAAAMAALGKIGTREAARALLRASKRSRTDLLPALRWALLACADRLAEQGLRDDALSIYDPLRRETTPAPIRAAATRGAILARGPRGTSLLLEQLRSDDQATADVALWMIQHESGTPGMISSVVAALPDLPAPRRVQLARALSFRGDPAALPALLSLADSGPKHLRLVVLRGASGFPGNAFLPALLNALTDPDEQVPKTARKELIDLPGKRIDMELTGMLESRDQLRRLLAIELLGARNVSGAVPALLRAAENGSPKVRRASLKVLETLAGEDQLQALLDILLQAVAAADASAAERALRAVCAKTRNAESTADKLVPLLPDASPARKQSLLRLLRAVGGSTACQAVQAATRDPDTRVREMAVRVLSGWRTTEAVPHLFVLAQRTGSRTEKVLCLRGIIRLADSKEAPVSRRLGWCRKAAGLIEREDEKKLLLGTLGGLPTPGALAMAAPYLQTPNTREEAAAAILAVADKLTQGPDAPRAAEALRKLLRTPASPEAIRRARILLARIQPE